MELDFIRNLKRASNTKIVFLLIDGLGGLPKKSNNLTEIESAITPNLDSLTSEGICGLHQTVGAGITPGSGPGHLSVFGYDPIKYKVGRGVLAALGINFKLDDDDIAVRGNYCTIDENGLIIDRRAGRISTDENKNLCKLLRNIRIPNVEIFVEPVKEHRFLLVFRGNNLNDDICDTDPQDVGLKPIHPKTFDGGISETSDLVSKFIEEAKYVLKDQNPANMIILRGFSQKPNLSSFETNFGLKSAAIAAYPMYKGISRLLGMKILESETKIESEFELLEKNWEEFDFFYIHIKGTDSAGEDGDFNRKVKIIEELDENIPRLIKLNPDVIVITGDHSTPSLMKYHSWHPVPVILWGKNCRNDNVKIFSEREFVKGSLGPRFPAVDIMPLALAHAKRLEKYGA
jgi:2,3-bisphosphoglycerate-independent phosphoglycerate mutase